jgi:muconolactone D-isomerase
MEFLISIEVSLPPEMPPATRDALLAQERVRGLELVESGVIRHIWRIPGRIANVAVWEAQDATALHEALVSLPVFPWTTIEVTPLATHPLMAGGVPRA